MITICVEKEGCCVFSVDKMARSFGECDVYRIGWRCEDADHIIARLHSPALDAHWTLCWSVNVQSYPWLKP